MGGIGSGRQKKPATLIKEAKEKDTKNLPKYFLKLSQMALAGDKEALVYLIDRHLGKPKAQADITSGGEKMGAGFLAELFSILEEGQRKLKGGYSPLQIAEGTTEKGDKDAIQGDTEAKRLRQGEEEGSQKELPENMVNTID